MSNIKQEWVDNIKEHLKRYFEGDDTIHKLIDDAIQKTYQEDDEIYSTLSLGEYYNLMKDGVVFSINVKSVRTGLVPKYQLNEELVDALIGRMKDYFRDGCFGDFLLDAIKYTYYQNKDISRWFDLNDYQKIVRLNLEFSDEPEVVKLKQAILENVLAEQMRRVRGAF